MKQFKGPKYQRGFAFLAALALSVAAGSTALSIKSGKKAAKAQGRANEAQRKANRLRNKQAKRTFLRKFRQAQALALTSGIARGVGIESSGVQGVLSSEISQKNTALAEFKEADALGTAFTDAQTSASNNQFKAQAFSQVANFASSFLSFSGEPDGE